MPSYHSSDIALLRGGGYTVEQVIPLENIPANSLASAFLRYIEEDMQSELNPFRLEPFQLFLVDDPVPDACAIHFYGRSVVVVHYGLLEAFHQTIYKRVPKVLPLGSPIVRIIEAASQHGFASFIFQLVTIFIFNHELCHLHQQKDRQLTEMQQQGERYSFSAEAGFDLLSHAVEVDADLFAATSIAHILAAFWVKLPEKDRTTATLQFLISSFGATVFLIFYSLQGGWKSLYFLAGSHPHALIRVTYILDAITTVLDGNGEAERPFSRDACQLDAFLITDKLLDSDRERGFQSYWEMFSNNINALESYVHQHIVPLTRQTPWLVQPRWTQLVRQAIERNANRKDG